jgi:hypothetical protein
MSIDEVEVYVTRDGHSRAAIVRRTTVSSASEIRDRDTHDSLARSSASVVRQSKGSSHGEVGREVSRFNGSMIMQEAGKCVAAAESDSDIGLFRRFPHSPGLRRDSLADRCAVVALHFPAQVEQIRCKAREKRA